MLEIKNLNVQYGKQNVLQDVSLSISKGEIFGLLGKNGAGKTTLFESIYQSKSYSGEMFLENQKLSRKNISYLETENFFYPYITGKEYLQYFVKNNDANELTQLAETFKLPLDKFIQDYSTGMKRKIALVGMLLLDKPVNILDEPFNGVDFEGVQLLYDVIGNLKKSGKIVIISSHIIETLFNTCDQIGILNNGSIEKIYCKENFEDLKNYSF